MINFFRAHLKMLLLSILGILILSIVIVEIRRHSLNVDFTNKIDNFFDNKSELRAGELHGFDERDGDFYSIDEVSSFMDIGRVNSYKENGVSTVFKPHYPNFVAYIVTKYGNNSFDLMKIRSGEIGLKNSNTIGNQTIDQLYKQSLETIILTKYDFVNQDYDRISNFLFTNNNYYKITMEEDSGKSVYKALFADSHVTYLDSKMFFCQPNFILLNYLMDLCMYFGFGLLIVVIITILLYFNKNKYV